MEHCCRPRRLTAAVDVPLLGVNLGSLGFLTEVPLQSLYPMLEAIGQGRAKVEHRSLMQVELLREDEVRGSYLVFNDAVVNKTALARLNTYDLHSRQGIRFQLSRRRHDRGHAHRLDRVLFICRRTGAYADCESISYHTGSAAFAHASPSGGARFGGD